MYVLCLHPSMEHCSALTKEPSSLCVMQLTWLELLKDCEAVSCVYEFVQEGSNSPPPPSAKDMGDPTTSPFFPGYVETSFSTAEDRFYYEGSKLEASLGNGTFADVDEYASRSPPSAPYPL